MKMELWHNLKLKLIIGMRFCDSNFGKNIKSSCVYGPKTVNHGWSSLQRDGIVNQIIPTALRNTAKF